MPFKGTQNNTSGILTAADSYLAKFQLDISLEAAGQKVKHTL